MRNLLSHRWYRACVRSWQRNPTMQTAILSCWMIIPGNSLSQSCPDPLCVGSEIYEWKLSRYVSTAFLSQSTKFRVRCKKKTLRVWNRPKNFWTTLTSCSCTSFLELRSSDSESSSSVFLAWGVPKGKDMGTKCKVLLFVGLFLSQPL